ncbi:Chitinase 2 [Mucor velutinosus]|uniref:ATP-dependent DNA helicase n=1 Tax=Mucor velutinosus TaxID=708070 RepID=A0AAN7I0Q6_9FUNG|nr:Chitinase 2 [Mucor velutinosus]
MCDLTPSSEIAQFIKRARLIIWVECSMIRKDLIETIDRTFKGVMKNSLPFGGRLIVFAGDFRQVLPIVPGASRSGIVSQCINRCYFWSQPTNYKQFSSYLLQIGERKVRTVTLPEDIPSDFVRIPDEMYLNSTNLLDLLATVFPNISNSSTIDQYFAKRVILTPKNQDVAVINNLLLDNLPGRKFTYYSYDQVCDSQFRMQVPLELLNSIESGSLPPHGLVLRAGSPIMILRNLDPSAGLCNGTKLIVKPLGVRIIEATIVTGPKAGDVVYIPRI